MSLTKGCQGSMGSTSSWSFWISLRAERALGHLGFHLTSSFAWYSFWGHLVVIVGGWGTPQAGVAVALLAKIKGGCTVSATVSANKVGVGGVVVAGSSQSACMTGSSTGGVGGCARKSCTRAQTSLMVWGGELVCSALILSIALPTLGDSVPMRVIIRVVQSASSLGS